MTSPLPWSYTALSDFRNCPWQFHETRVTKRIVRTQGDEAKWGEYVHKQFEHRQATGNPLPTELAEHEAFMTKLDRIPGETLYVESKVALNKHLQPCEFFAKDVWWRGVIDWKKWCAADRRVALTDYKTGKPGTNFDQLDLFTLHTFARHPDVDIIDARYYWTQTGTETRKVYGRDEIPKLWATFVPDLKQYVLAFKEDVWQKRQSGLCNGWCPVTDCEFWRPRKARR